MKKFGKIWADPVWSKVISAAIIGLAIASWKWCADLSWDDIKDQHDLLSRSKMVLHLGIVPLVVSIAGAASVWASISISTNKYLNKLKLKYRKITMFQKLYRQNPPSTVALAQFSHLPAAQTLFEEMKADKLITSLDNLTLTKLGEIVRESTLNFDA